MNLMDIGNVNYDVIGNDDVKKIQAAPHMHA